MFSENKEAVQLLIDDIDKVIYAEDFLHSFIIDYKVNVISMKLKALIILEEIEKLEPKENFYSKYQVPWPSERFCNYRQVAQAIEATRTQFEALKNEDFKKIAIEEAPKFKQNDLSGKEGAKKGGKND